MPAPCPRLAVRAVILRGDRLLLVNAYPGGRSPLLCAPGGGVERGASLPENLRREVWEECGLEIAVGAPCLINEFHDPGGEFHQVDVYFRCDLLGDGVIDPGWRDRERIVSEWHWVTAAELAELPHKPDSLAAVAFGPAGGPSLYDSLEPIVR